MSAGVWGQGAQSRALSWGVAGTERGTALQGEGSGMSPCPGTGRCHLLCLVVALQGGVAAPALS